MARTTPLPLTSLKHCLPAVDVFSDEDDADGDLPKDPTLYEDPDVLDSPVTRPRQRSPDLRDPETSWMRSSFVR